MINKSKSMSNLQQAEASRGMGTESTKVTDGTGDTSEPECNITTAATLKVGSLSQRNASIATIGAVDLKIKEECHCVGASHDCNEAAVDDHDTNATGILEAWNQDN